MSLDILTDYRTLYIHILNNSSLFEMREFVIRYDIKQNLIQNKLPTHYTHLAIYILS